jgi:methionyl-tRNA formyltransferase
MKVIFFGTPQFAAETLDYLLKNSINVVAVVTKPDRPKGRSAVPQPTPVKLIARAQETPIPVFQPELVSSLEFAPTLSAFEADLFVVAAYGEIIKQHLLDMPRLGCINLHASLLPKYRGAAPIQRSIMEGESETGITIMHMVKKMDAGDIIKMVSTPIEPHMTYGELEQILCTLGSKALLEVIKEFENNIFHRTPQDHSLATFAPKIELEECEIDWQLSAQEIHNQVRGVNPHPGAWCKVIIKDKILRLKVLKTIVHKDLQGIPGEILKYDSDGFNVACGKGALQLIEVQLEGKKAMLSTDLIRGIAKPDFAFCKNPSITL